MSVNVEARLTNGRFEVRVAPGALRRCDDNGLAAEAQATVAEVMASHQPEQAAEPYDPASMSRDDPRRRCAEALREIECVAQSPRQLAKARWRAGSGLEVRIRPGTCGRIDVTEAQLAAEVEHAVNEAMTRYGEAVVRRYTDIFRIDF